MVGRIRWTPDSIAMVMRVIVKATGRGGSECLTCLCSAEGYAPFGMPVRVVIRTAGAACACLAMAAATGCGSEINLGDAVAQVSGAIYYVGGPPAPDGKVLRRGPEPGTVTVIASNGHIAARRRFGSAGYGVGLQTGAYTITAASGDARCPRVHIHVQIGTVRRFDVNCSVA